MAKGEKKFIAFIDKKGKITEVYPIVGTKIAPSYVSKRKMKVLPTFTFGPGAYGVTSKRRRNAKG